MHFDRHPLHLLRNHAPYERNRAVGHKTATKAFNNPAQQVLAWLDDDHPQGLKGGCSGLALWKGM
jgi:hypothetical protein